MPKLDPGLERALSALVQGLRALEVPFCVVGALVQELLSATPPPIRTNDADAVIIVPSLKQFEAVKEGLSSHGFSRTSAPQRLLLDGGGIVDILPYSRELAPSGTLELDRDTVFNMAGFDQAVDSALHVTLDSGLVVPVVPLPLYALLKLVAYTDRKAEKDLSAVEHLLRNYAEADERIWGLEYDGELIEVDYASAYLLGQDGTAFVDESVAKVIGPLLATLSAGAGESENDLGEEEWRVRREDLFLWYQRGLDISRLEGDRQEN